MTEYRNTQIERQRTEMFERFTRYIISRCWRKMRRRINHVSSLGFLYILRRMDASTIERAFADFHNTGMKPPRLRKDSNLGNLLISFTEEQVETVMKHHPATEGSHPDAGPTGVYLRLSRLRSAFAKVLKPGSQLLTAYDAATCVEFNQLLVATLFGYASSLRQLRDANATRNEFRTEKENEVLRQAALDVWNFAHILWRIAYSRILLYHLMVLHNKKLLVLPKDFTDNARMKSTHNAPFAWPSQEAYTDPTQADEVEDDVEEEEELINDSMPLTYRRWIRLQSIHFIAASVLSSFSAQHSLSPSSPSRASKPSSSSPNSRPLVGVSLLAVRPPSVSDKLKMNPWKEMIATLSIPDTPNSEGYDCEVALQFIESQLGAPYIHGETHTIMQRFTSTSVEFSGTKHCEGALAALTKCGVANMNESEAVRNVISVRSRQILHFSY